MRSVRRTALGEDEEQVKVADRHHRFVDHHQGEARHQLRQRDVHETLQHVGTVDFGRAVQVGPYRLQRDQQQDGRQRHFLPDKGVGALNEEAFKSSAGALEHIQVVRVSSLLKAVDTLHLNGIQVFTSEMRADKNVHELDLTIPSCIIMGDEGKGVQPYLAKAADYFFKIPMATNFDSFNVSVAAGIILYESMKQRLFK